MKTAKNQSNYRLQSAFTMIEMIIAIGILAILVSIAAPNFVQLKNRTALSNISENVRYALSLARHTAVNTGRITTICHSNGEGSAQPACNAGQNSNWAKGAIIYTVAPRSMGGGNQVFNGARDSLIKQVNFNNDAINIATNPVNINVISFAPSGKLLNSSKITLTICNPNISGEKGSIIEISPTGRINQPPVPDNTCT